MRAMPNTIQRLPGPHAAATAGPAWNLHQPRPDPAPARQGPLDLREGGKDSGAGAVQRSEIVDAFHALDADQSGSVSAEELRPVLMEGASFHLCFVHC